MKATGFFCLILLASLFFAAPVSAKETSQPPSVEVDGSILLLEGTDVVVSGDRILIPADELIPALGARQSWDEQKAALTITKGSQQVTVIVNLAKISVNGKTASIEQPPRILTDRVMLPLRAVSEALGARVSWYADTRTAMVDTQPKSFGIIEKSILQTAAEGSIKTIPFSLGTPRDSIEKSWGKPIDSFYYEGGEFFAYSKCNCAALYSEHKKLSILWLNQDGVGNLKTADLRQVLGKPKWEEESQTHLVYLLYYPTGKNSLMFQASSLHGSIIGLWLSDRWWW